MRITKLSLTNFRSFKEKQTIEFAPVTLLFGPNSVGKSTVLMALFYVQQILTKGQCNPQYIDALGKKFVGGFKNLVNGKNLDKAITIGIEFSKEGVIGSSYYNLIDLELVDFYLDSPSVEADTVSVTLEIKWSKQENTAYISSLEIGLDDKPAAILSSDSGLKKPEISWINYAHSLLNFETDFYEKAKDYPAACISTFHEYCVGNVAQQSLDYLEEYPGKANYALPKLVQQRFGIKAYNGCLPQLKSLLNVNVQLFEELKFYTESGVEIDSGFKNQILVGVINEIFSDLIVAPIDNLKNLLDSSLCIGPLRHIPDAQYQPNPYPQQEDWYDGKACWDTLSKEHHHVFFVNDWLASSNKLGMGLNIAYKVSEGMNRLVTGQVPHSISDLIPIKDALGKRFYAEVSTSQSLNDPKAKKVILNFEDTLPEFFMPSEKLSININGEEYQLNSDFYLNGEKVKETSLTLWDINNQVEVNLSDVGVGVSQLLPLVTATSLPKKGLIACEQPELHVHPRVQVGIGDLLTQGSEKPSFLIETHSEHLVLRLLRRVRESTEGNLPEGFKVVKPDDISVVFLEHSPEGAKANRIAVTDDGDFETDWPGGFFDERDQELF